MKRRRFVICLMAALGSVVAHGQVASSAAPIPADGGGTRTGLSLLQTIRSSEPGAEGIGGTYVTSLSALSAVTGRGDGAEDGRPLVVRAGGRELPALDDTVADIQVLTRIVRRLADPEPSWGDLSVVKPLLLEGYGLVLLMSAPFPLAPRAAGEPERATDALWEETTRELWGADPRNERQPYDAENAEALIGALKAALAYARHVRGLPADGTVSIIVTASHRSIQSRARSHADDQLSILQNRWQAAYSDFSARAAGGNRSARGSSRLILSTPVSQVRALADGKVTEAAFKAAVDVRTVFGSDVDMEEDLTVLSAVLFTAFQRRVVGAEAEPPSTSTFAFSTVGRSAPRPAYINGYGVVIQAQVDFPLRAAAGDVAKQQPTDRTASLWEQTQREMGKPSDSGGGSWSMLGRPPTVAYDGRKVRDTKEALIDTLGEAGNVRGLGDGESVAIVLWGTASVGNTSGAMNSEPYAAEFYGAMRPARIGGTLLTAHAAKLDIDVYAAGRITRAQFTERVTFHSELTASSGGRGALRYSVSPYGGSDPNRQLPSPNIRPGQVIR